MVEQSGVEPQLGLLADLRLQIGIAEVLRRDPAEAPEPDRSAIGLNGREHVRLQAGTTPGTAELELRKESRTGEERFLRNHPRGAEFGIIDGIEVGAEGAVPVRPQRRRDKQAVFPGDLLLAIDAQRLVLLKGLGRLPPRPAADIARARNRKLEPLRELLIELLVIVLDADGRRRHEVGVDRPIGVGAVVDGEERAAQVQRLLLTEARAEEWQVAGSIAEDELRRFVVRDVGSNREAVPQPREGPVIELHAERHALDVVEAVDPLVVLGPVELKTVSGAVPAGGRGVLRAREPAGLAPGEIAGPDNRRRDRLRSGRSARARAHGPQAQVGRELSVGGLIAEVPPACKLVLPVIVDRPFFAIVGGAEEIADLIGSAADVAGEAPRCARAEDGGEATGLSEPLHVELSDVGRIPVVPPAAEIKVRRIALLGIAEPGGAGIGLELDGRPAGTAPLGEDLDDAVGRFGAVNRRGGRAFEDLD